ncbi:type IV pilus modification PilV family protein [Hydrogenophilus thiooxidans]|uniref:type IV pilus modification PilV family protein n=1 Tax=Hydrogenophilus thiooxidans TaxID=2820326 RepID=UPI001C237758|nr:prepilin-type N-terminal cleavage/methylation domain-containing protein [Hydrogenophilus thiooxidans]
MWSRQEQGVTLVETVVAVVILSIAVGGLLLALQTAVRGSSDPLVRKQMLAIAEGMLEEVLLQPYSATYPPVNPSPSLLPCSSAASRAGFATVAHYQNYATSGICNLDGSAVSGLDKYQLRVTLTPTTLSVGGFSLAAVKVTVTVTHGGESLSVSGWKGGS